MLSTTGLPRLGAALAAAGLQAQCWRCSSNVSTGSRVENRPRERHLATGWTEAGQKPQTVTCKDDLMGEVGKTTRCEVVLSSDNSFEPVITVTKVEGTTVSYDMTPALSKYATGEGRVRSLANRVTHVQHGRQEGTET